MNLTFIKNNDIIPIGIKGKYSSLFQKQKEAEKASFFDFSLKL